MYSHRQPLEPQGGGLCSVNDYYRNINIYYRLEFSSTVTDWFNLYDFKAVATGLGSLG